MRNLGLNIANAYGVRTLRATQIYNHILRLFERIPYIILAILGFIIVSVLYYLGNFYGFVAGAVFAMLYAIIMNRRIIGKITGRIAR